MDATNILSEEHRIIEQVLACLEEIGAACQRDGFLDSHSARQAIQFLRSFADGCHHGKEENFLFPLLEKRGLPAQGPTAVMRAEHEEGRRHLRAMENQIDRARAGNVEAMARFASHAQAYVDLLRRHIDKEDHVLFPMADSLLSEADQKELCDAFVHIESHDLEENAHEKLVEMAHELTQRLHPAHAAPVRPVHCCYARGHSSA